MDHLAFPHHRFDSFHHSFSLAADDQGLSQRDALVAEHRPLSTSQQTTTDDTDSIST